MGKNNIKSELKGGVGKGILSGFISSLCCVGPLVIVLFGLGTVSFALSLGQYRLYFLILGFLSMTGAIVLHLKKENKTCKVNHFNIKGLKKEKTFIISIILSTLIIYIFSIYILVPLISPFIYKNAVSETQSVLENSENQNLINLNSELNKLNVKITGMTCIGCSSGVQSILQNLEGVIEAEISYREGTGEIIYDSSIITKEEIVNSDAFLTYPAEIVSDESLS